MRWLFIVGTLWLGGCSKCAPTPVRFDAGAPVRRSTDLRTALIYTYPEYRGTALIEASAKVTRVIPGLTAEQRDVNLEKLHYVVTDGGAGWDLNKFHLEQPAHDTLAVSLPLSADDVGQLYSAPAALSSLEMAQYLPRELPVKHEVFELALHYSSSPERCRQLVRQAVMLLEGNSQWRVSKAPPSWTPDAQGDADLPENFTVEVSGPEGAHISWDRARGQVRVKYVFETVR